VRLIKTGVDDDGLSCVKSIEDLQRGEFWATESFPPDLGYVRPKTVDADELSVGLVPGTGSCSYISFEPNHKAGPLHRFDGFSILTIFRGSTTLILQNGSVELTVGDAVIFPGVIHTWEAGPEGCEFTTMRFGIGRP
jgi:quercetin dioxygenase-like cupin family protein